MQGRSQKDALCPVFPPRSESFGKPASLVGAPLTEARLGRALSTTDVAVIPSAPPDEPLPNGLAAPPAPGGHPPACAVAGQRRRGRPGLCSGQPCACHAAGRPGNALPGARVHAAGHSQYARDPARFPEPVHPFGRGRGKGDCSRSTFPRAGAGRGQRPLPVGRAGPAPRARALRL